MAVDRTDFENLRQRHQKSIAPDVGSLRVIERDALQAQYLTSQPHWDRFLTMLQAALKRMEEVRRSAQAVLNALDVIDHGALIRAKINLLTAEAQIDILQSVMSMPRELIEHGDKARDLLQKFGSPDSGTPNDAA